MIRSEKRIRNKKEVVEMCDHFYNLFLLFLYRSWFPSARLDELLHIIGNLRIENCNRQMGESESRHIRCAHARVPVTGSRKIRFPMWNPNEK